MTTETKRFPVRDLLTVTTGRLLTDIRNVYTILGWMTQDEPFTHQLPRFADECKPWLLRWFPELEAVHQRLGNLDILIGGAKSERRDTGPVVEQWLATERERCNLKDEYDVPRIPQDDHERKHPYDELVAMRGTDEGIIVVKE